MGLSRQTSNITDRKGARHASELRVELWSERHLKRARRCTGLKTPIVFGSFGESKIQFVGSIISDAFSTGEQGVSNEESKKYARNESNSSYLCFEKST